jgi:hypothetical protein
MSLTGCRIGHFPQKMTVSCHDWLDFFKIKEDYQKNDLLDEAVFNGV